MDRKASAVWVGGLKDGKGSLSTDSGTLKQTQYSFSTRFENGVGTNPEELLAAAHAGCFTMALSAFLGRAGFKPEKLNTQATLSFEQDQESWVIRSIHLEVSGVVPEIEQPIFEEIAGNAKENCPVSKVLNAMITLSVKLEK